MGSVHRFPSTQPVNRVSREETIIFSRPYVKMPNAIAALKNVKHKQLLNFLDVLILELKYGMSLLNCCKEKKKSVVFLPHPSSHLRDFLWILLKMSQSEDEKVDFRSVLSQLKFSNSDDFEQNTALSADSLSSETASSTWVEIYKRYRRPLAPSSWEWSQKSRPGKHCDSHLLDFFACIDKTQDKLGMTGHHWVGVKSF